MEESLFVNNTYMFVDLKTRRLGAEVCGTKNQFLCGCVGRTVGGEGSANSVLVG
jgi:hypothetical protein